MRVSVDRLRIRGTTTDNGRVKRVTVSGQEAKATRENFAEWKIEIGVLDAPGGEVIASADDAHGNVEPRPHAVRLGARQFFARSCGGVTFLG